MRHVLTSILFTAVGLAVSAAAARGDFLPGYDLPGVTNQVNAALAFDDGGGDG
ncbi:MAG: hypothetical protein AAGF23_21655 [Acidobacteriota bacterium]